MKARAHLIPGLLLLAALCVGCVRDRTGADAQDHTPYPLVLPAGFPELPVPADNPLTQASVELGKALFFDQRLSLGQGFSCATCHMPQRAFSDTVALSTGVNGGTGMRNAPTLADVAYHPLLNRDGGAPTLEQQVFVPLMEDQEMDADPQRVVELLATDTDLQARSMRAYGRPMDLFVLTRSLANYERTLLSGRSRYDRWAQGDGQALTQAEQQGLALFQGVAGCATCHSGFDLSDHGFHNVGTAAVPGSDPGRQRITQNPLDRGKFKTPTLRNIGLTAPYMHDGSMADLEEVIAHFDGGGPADPLKDPLVMPLGLSGQDRQDLAAFLRALTDEPPLGRSE